MCFINQITNTREQQSVVAADLRQQGPPGSVNSQKTWVLVFSKVLCYLTKTHLVVLHIQTQRLIKTHIQCGVLIAMLVTVVWGKMQYFITVGAPLPLGSGLAVQVRALFQAPTLTASGIPNGWTRSPLYHSY